MKTALILILTLSTFSASSQKVHAATLSLYKWNQNVGWVAYDAKYVDLDFEINDSTVTRNDWPILKYDPSKTDVYTKENIAYRDLKGKDDAGDKCLISSYTFLRTNERYLAVMYEDRMYVYRIAKE